MHLPAIGLVQIRQERTDDCAAQVTCVERLRNVRRRKLNKGFLSLARVVRAIRRLALALAVDRSTLTVCERMHRCECQRNKRLFVHIVQDRRARLVRALDVIVRLELV